MLFRRQPPPEERPVNHDRRARLTELEAEAKAGLKVARRALAERRPDEHLAAAVDATARGLRGHRT